MATGEGSIWERDTLQVYALMARIYLGEIAELARLTEQRLYEARNRGDLFAETIYVASRANIHWLREDAPDLKRRDVDEALRRWGQPGRFQIQHWYAMQSHVQVDFYAGEPLNALRRIVEAWPALRRSFLLRVQNLRIEAHSIRAFAAIRVAAQGTDVAAMLSVAERDGAAIFRERSPWGQPIGLLVRAGIALARRSEAAAAGAIAEATRLFDGQGMALHAAAAKMWRGTIVGGDEGRGLVAEAASYFATEGIRDAGRVASIFVPK